MERTINKPTAVVEPTVQYTGIFTFRTQELMDLWINEIQGQISDGMWENSRNTNWLWQGAFIYKLGEKTELKVRHQYFRKRTSFGWVKDLECIEDRATEENGFSNVKEMKKGWNEIARAIREHTEYSQEEMDKYIYKPRDLAAKQKKEEEGNLKDYALTVPGVFEKEGYLTWTEDYPILNKVTPVTGYRNPYFKVEAYLGHKSIEFSVKKENLGSFVAKLKGFVEEIGEDLV